MCHRHEKRRNGSYHVRKAAAKATAKATCNEEKRIRSLLMLNAPTDKRHAITGFAAPQVILQLKRGTACKHLRAGNIDSLPTKKSIEGPRGGQRMLNSATPSDSQYGVFSMASSIHYLSNVQSTTSASIEQPQRPKGYHSVRCTQQKQHSQIKTPVS